MRQRHYGSDIMRGTAWLWCHFTESQLVIVASVRQPANAEEQQACQARLDRLEVDLRYRLRCLDEHGGMTVRDENHTKKFT